MRRGSMRVLAWSRLPAATRGFQTQRTGSMGNAPEDVPEEVIAQAKAAFARRSQGDVAILTWDSLVDEDASAGDHWLRFEHPALQIELRILAADNRSDLEGSAKPPIPLHVEL